MKKENKKDTTKKVMEDLQIENKEFDVLVEKLKSSLKETKENILAIEQQGYKVVVSPFYRDKDFSGDTTIGVRVHLDISKTIKV
ncbi:hypothetical protein ACFO4P_15900 [Epilithonimonas pallida]|uniref:Uncharacterized protein n=1 Tax=Epilithonimonas pallida TaxID=373671 RepID=A0ABY1R0K9_9FLAO|nr:hypothetical protein [Epilithonimonas pallida]SMP88554.1 hypothetical protein SAMN05421679_101515 [Epilithonimonas pallida]